MEEAEVAGGEVELLVVERVVGDVHLAVDGGDVVGGGAGVVECGGGVVIQARGAALEEGSDDDEGVLADDGGERGGRGAGDGLGEVEEGVVLALAEVLRAEELGQADESAPCPAASRTRATALARLASVEGSQDIWMRATRVVGIGMSALSGQAKRRWDSQRLSFVRAGYLSSKSRSRRRWSSSRLRSLRRRRTG